MKYWSRTVVWIACVLHWDHLYYLTCHYHLLPLFIETFRYLVIWILNLRFNGRLCLGYLCGRYYRYLAVWEHDISHEYSFCRGIMFKLHLDYKALFFNFLFQSWFRGFPSAFYVRNGHLIPCQNTLKLRFMLCLQLYVKRSFFNVGKVHVLLNSFNGCYPNWTYDNFFCGKSYFSKKK